MTQRQYQPRVLNSSRMAPGSSLARPVMVSAMSAKTATGAMSMIMKTTLMTTSCRPWKTANTGLRLSSGTCTRAMPMSRLTKTICSMLRLSLAEPMKLSGTMFTNGASGPLSLVLLALATPVLSLSESILSAAKLSSPATFCPLACNLAF